MSEEEQTLSKELARLLDGCGISRREFLAASGKLLSSCALISLASGCGGGISPQDLAQPGCPVDEEAAPQFELNPKEFYYFLDSTSFSDLGGWRLDTQFFEQQGAASLLAEGFGSPVAPAKLPLTVGAAGNYRLFVHTRNWDTRLSPGRFQVSIAGQTLNTVLGAAPTCQWTWEPCGNVDLAPGTTEIAFYDLTGEYGRFNAVLLTTDAQFLPPQGKTGLAALRAKILASLPVQDVGTYDFVVVGGGLAATFAALAAARNGLQVALLQNRPVLGGNSSEEVGVTPASAATENANGRETGLVEELTLSVQQTSSSDPYGAWQKALAAACAAEPNLSLFLNTECTGTLMGGASQISGVLATNLATSQPLVVHGSLFADCTGDAQLGVAAGAEFRQGSEARSTYHEGLAPATANTDTQGSSLLYHLQAMPEDQPFTAPTWAHYFDEDSLPHRPVDSLGPFWWMEWGGTEDTIANAEEIRDELLRIIYGLWDYIKNRSPLADQARRYVLRPLPVVGKRESRRLLGDYVLVEPDLLNNTAFADAVGFGGWPIDLHPPEGIYSSAQPTSWYHVNLYSVPFRSLYSRNIGNLMMAGRNISVSHVALGSTRIMGTGGVLGQAVGTAAALCHKYDISPRDLLPNHISELQQLMLRDDAYIIGLRNEDPLDLARSATVTASSTMQADFDYSPGNVINGITRTLGSSPNMWASDPSQPMPQWLQLDLNEPNPVSLVQIVFDTDLDRTSNQPNAPQTVGNYEVQVFANSSWSTVAKVAQNYQRLRRHAFAPLLAAAIRVVVHATNGDPSARIYEVRIYGTCCTV